MMLRAAAVAAPPGGHGNPRRAGSRVAMATARPALSRELRGRGGPATVAPARGITGVVVRRREGRSRRAQRARPRCISARPCGCGWRPAAAPLP